MPKNANDQRANIFPALKCRDAPAAMKWLGKAFGFRTHFSVPGEKGTIAHAELQFGAGMVMLGSMRAPDPKNPWATEAGLYVHAHYARARKAGADIVRGLADTEHGSREHSARDVEGKLWSFGTYLPGTEP